jgi:adenine-specific DNA-methyltransferase
MGVEHSIWLSLIRDRLEIIRRLLSSDGSLWITIDDNEAHYLKVVCDEVFGRACFVTSFIWKKVDSPNDNKGALSPDHEYVLCYTKTPGGTRFRQKQDESILNAYKQPDAESDRPYRDRLLKKNGKNSLRADRPSMYFPIKGPDGADVYPIHDDGQEARWAMGLKGVDELVAKGELVWKQRESNGFTRWVPYTREYAPDSPSRPWPTIWADLDTTRQTKAHQKVIFGDIPQFETPKPEDLISRIFGVSTEPGDLVLDSFAGSGTTGAVAHKMGRRWIMIELGEHCHTHIIPRLKKVIDGDDQGGISEAVKLEGRRRLPLLPPCPQPVAARPLGPVGHQQGLQRRNAGGGDMQAGGLHLRAQRRALLATRQEHRERLHLRHDAKPDAGAVAGLER